MRDHIQRKEIEREKTVADRDRERERENSRESQTIAHPALFFHFFLAKFFVI